MELEDSGVLVVITPLYNNGYRSVLKNAFDYLLPESRYKPVGIVTLFEAP